MARTLPTNIAAAADDGYYTSIHMIELRGGASTYRWTDAPLTVSYGGNDFTPMAFMPGEVVTTIDGQQACEVTFYDVDRVLRALLLGEDWSLRPMTLWEAWLPSSGSTSLTDDDVLILIDGRADGGNVDLSDETEPLVIAILPETEREGAPGPAQEFSSSCRYVNQFKGLQCGYAGAETTCDGSKARCAALGNSARFGGFPYAPRPGSKVTVGVTTHTLRRRG